jgi:formylglycine-generating enzyme required for sulfatase activity
MTANTGRTMRAILLVACTLLALALGTAGARAERFALVIGNSAYRNVAALPNPKNDSADMADSLRRLGFTVTHASDLGFDDMRKALLAFGRQIRGAEIALVFYAGHGMEVGGENWLIPTDAELRSDTDAEHEAVSLRSVVLQLSQVRRLGLIILDACRNNPFAAKMQRSARVRAVERGLARTEPADNLLVAYASRDGTTADDGHGRNSPFTTALLRHIETPGLEVRFLFASVRDDVMEATRREQQPFVYGSLSREQIFLKSTPESSAGVPGLDPAGQAWVVTQHSTSTDVLEEFIRRFGNSFYAALARARLEELKKAQVAVVAPPVPPTVPPGAGVTPAIGVYPATPRPAPDMTPLALDRERALQPKDAFKECDACPEMVVMPQGSFMRGSPESENERRSHEGPQRLVTLSYQFAVGRFAVTFDEWDACVAGGGCNGFRPDDEGWGRGRLPVINVSWDQAKTYAAWLSRRTGKTYRLLSEAEREYVTRAGTTTPYWWGASISASQANYSGAVKRTVPVDLFQPNPFGLYQVHGNVWEWTEDCYADSYNGAPADGSARLSANCKLRVLRGGSWHNNPPSLRAATRINGAEKVFRTSGVGFRVGRTLTR